MNVNPSHILEYALLRAASGLLAALPHRAALALAWGPARVAFLPGSGLRARTLRRLRQAWANTNKARQVDNDTREHVLAHIREHGPQDASGLGLEGKVDWHWAATSLSRAALEQLADGRRRLA